MRRGRHAEVINDAGVIGLTGNGKSFPATEARCAQPPRLASDLSEIVHERATVVCAVSPRADRSIKASAPGWIGVGARAIVLGQVLDAAIA